MACADCRATNFVRKHATALVGSTKNENAKNENEIATNEKKANPCPLHTRAKTKSGYQKDDSTFCFILVAITSDTRKKQHSDIYLLVIAVTQNGGAEGRWQMKVVAKFQNDVRGSSSPRCQHRHFECPVERRRVENQHRPSISLHRHPLTRLERQNEKITNCCKHLLALTQLCASKNSKLDRSSSTSSSPSSSLNGSMRNPGNYWNAEEGVNLLGFDGGGTLAGPSAGSGAELPC